MKIHFTRFGLNLYCWYAHCDILSQAQNHIFLFDIIKDHLFFVSVVNIQAGQM